MQDQAEVVEADAKGLELVPQAERPFFANEVSAAAQSALALLAKDDPPDAAVAWRQLKNLHEGTNTAVS